MRYLLVCALTFSCLGTAHAGSSCGIEPLKPIPPIGTDECRMVQVVDADGNCHWIAICE